MGKCGYRPPANVRERPPTHRMLSILQAMAKGRSVSIPVATKFGLLHRGLLRETFRIVNGCTLVELTPKGRALVDGDADARGAK